MASAQKKLEVKPDYEKVVLEVDGEKDDYLMIYEMEIPFEKKKPVVVSHVTTDNPMDYTTWKVTSSKINGTITYHYSEEKGHWWECNFDGHAPITVLISPYMHDANDPRMMQISQGDQVWYMPTGEPDCNSIWGLYKESFESEYDYESEEVTALLSGSVSKGHCAKGMWTFNLANKDISQEVKTAFVFASAMAMNVRNMYWMANR